MAAKTGRKTRLRKVGQRVQGTELQSPHGLPLICWKCAILGTF